MWLANKLLYADALTAASSSMGTCHLRWRERFRSIVCAAEVALRALENSPPTDEGSPRVPSAGRLCASCVRLLSAARKEGCWLRALLSEQFAHSLLFLDTAGDASHPEVSDGSSSTAGHLVALVSGTQSAPAPESAFTKIKPRPHLEATRESVNGPQGEHASSSSAGHIPPSNSHYCENPDERSSHHLYLLPSRYPVRALLQTSAEPTTCWKQNFRISLFDFSWYGEEFNVFICAL